MSDRTPSFVDGYLGAVRLLHMPTFPGRVHFICHVVRGSEEEQALSGGTLDCDQHPSIPVESHSLRRPPVFAILAADQCVGLGVVCDLFRRRVELQRAADARGDVGQMRQ